MGFLLRSSYQCRRLPLPAMAAKTWILTGSLDNFRATRDHGFRVIGMKERRRNLAE